MPSLVSGTKYRLQLHLSAIAHCERNMAYSDSVFVGLCCLGFFMRLLLENVHVIMCAPFLLSVQDSFV